MFNVNLEVWLSYDVGRSCQNHLLNIVTDQDLFNWKEKEAKRLTKGEINMKTD